MDGSIRGVSHNSCNLKMKLDKTRMSVFFHNARSYDNHFLMKAADPAKHGRISAIPKTSEQYISVTIGNLVIKDSVQFMGKSLDSLVKTLDVQDMKISKEYLRSYVRKISDDPELLESDTLGLYDKEEPGKTYEIATVEKRQKKKKKKPPDDMHAEVPEETPVYARQKKPPDRRAEDLLDNEVTVEDDNREEE